MPPKGSREKDTDGARGTAPAMRPEDVRAVAAEIARQLAGRGGGGKETKKNALRVSRSGADSLASTFLSSHGVCLVFPV